MATRTIATGTTVPRTRPAIGPADAAEPDVPWHNSVTLCGRLTGAPEPVGLPSGDPLWRFRVTVARPVTRASRRSAETPRRVFDAVDCSTGSAKLVARLERAAVGAVVEVGGTLTRRFWRAAGGPASRYEVVVDRVTVVRRAAGVGTSG